MLPDLRIVLNGLRRKISYSLNQFLGYFRQHVERHRLAWRVVGAGAAMAAVCFVALIVYALLLIPFTPSVSDIHKARIDQPSVLLSSDGKELATFRRLNREWVSLDRVPRHVIDALIATEDHRFYQHHGIDLRRTAGAALRNLNGHHEGGSTITQQLARNLFPDEIGNAPTMTRKIKEAITAFKLEYAYSKDQILETYLNTVPFLYNADGIEMAARTYFNTSTPQLTLVQGATLVGMLKGTAYYNPVLNPDRALFRRNLVLAQMVKQGTLTQARYDSLRRRPLDTDFEVQKPWTGPSPHLAEQVRRWLIGWAEREGYNIYADGLVVQSTIDSRLQHFANQAVTRQLDALQAVAEVEWGSDSRHLMSTHIGAYKHARRRVPGFRHFWQANPQFVEAFVRETPEFAKLKAAGKSDAEAIEKLLSDDEFMTALRERKTRLEAGFVAIDPRSGAIRAWVGSRDFEKDQYDHVAQARRQPGSTFKAFVYGAALEAGMPPDRPFVDQAVSIPLEGGGVWRPNDAHPASGETMTLEDGLVYSKNTITAQVIEQVGPQKVARLARRAGVRDSRLEAVPSLALGTSPVTLLEMVTAYGTIAGLGEYSAPRFVTRVTDRHGRVLVEFRPETERAMSRETATQLIGMMRGVVDRGTGTGIRRGFGITADVAGKTGTTQNNTDGWFILMHPQLVAGAWVGFNDPRVRMRSDHWGQGAHNALYVVGDFYRQALAAKALDAAAEFPGRVHPSPVENTFGRAGNWLRNLFGLDPPQPPSRPHLAPVERRAF